MDLHAELRNNKIRVGWYYITTFQSLSIITVLTLSLLTSCGTILLSNPFHLADIHEYQIWGVDCHEADAYLAFSWVTEWQRASGMCLLHSLHSIGWSVSSHTSPSIVSGRTCLQPVEVHQPFCQCLYHLLNNVVYYLNTIHCCLSRVIFKHCPE